MLSPPLRQRPDLPGSPSPIVSIGAGGIVRDSHLPAYRKAGWAVASVFDLDAGRAGAIARDFGIPRVCATLDQAVTGAAAGSVFDVAVPASAILGILSALPDGARVLIQKPPGENLAEATAIR